MKGRSEQDQRPKRRRHDRRGDLGDSRQVGVVAVLGGDDYADHCVCERDQTAHSIIFASRACPIHTLPAQADACSVKLPGSTLRWSGMR